jgi:high-affinity Fe2+/Pb2+ permease
MDGYGSTISKMNFEIILVLGTLITVIGLLIVFLIRKRRPKIKKKTDYRVLFNMGTIFLGAGIAISIATKTINPLFILGLVYFIMGLANKDKWKTNDK